MFENFLRARAYDEAAPANPGPGRRELESRIGPLARAVQMAPGLLSWFLFNRGIPDV